MPPNKYLPVTHQYGSKSAAAKLANYLKTLQIKQLELLNEKQAENLFCFLLEEYLLNDLSLSAYVNLNSQLSFLFMDKNFGDVGAMCLLAADLIFYQKNSSRNKVIDAWRTLLEFYHQIKAAQPQTQKSSPSL